MKTPEFIYFDLGKVVLDFSHEAMCQQMGEAVGIDGQRANEIVFGTDLSDRYETGELSCDEFCDGFFEAAGASCDKATLLRAGSDIFRPIRSMIPLIQCLATSGIRMGILSNTCKAHWDFVLDGRYCYLASLFSHFALSFELGARKPEAVIYEKACELVQCDPENVFFVDDREDNIQGAREAGLDAHVFESSHQVYKLLWERGVRCNY